MRISGADDSGWVPIDLTEVAKAITVLQRLTGTGPGGGLGPEGVGRAPLPTQADAPAAESLPGA